MEIKRLIMSWSEVVRAAASRPADWRSTLQGCLVEAVGTYELERLAAVSAGGVLPVESDLIRSSQSNGALLQKISQGPMADLSIMPGENLLGLVSWPWHLAKADGTE